MARACLIALALMVQSGCSKVGSCHLDSPATPPPAGGCVDAWRCVGLTDISGSYEVRCSPRDDAGIRACQCFRDGRAGLMTEGTAVWCKNGFPDAVERKLDANQECGWHLDTSDL